MSAARSIELSVEVPGSPEEVWEAVATGPGITSWFIPMQVEEAVGGAVRMDVGPSGTDTGTVTAWEPPRRVVFEGLDSPSGRLAYEWRVEPAGPGTCTVRLANTGFADSPAGAADHAGMAAGWTIFLESLRLHLTHFRGRRAVAVVPVAMLPGPHEAAWSAFCATLGVPAGLASGQRVQPTAAGAPALSAVAQQVARRPAITAALLLVDGPVPGTGFLAAEGDGDQVACSMYLYLYGEGAAEHARAWEAWMAATFPAPPELSA